MKHDATDHDRRLALALALEAQREVLLGQRFSLREVGLRAVALSIITNHWRFDELRPAAIARKFRVSHSALSDSVKKVKAEMQALADGLPAAFSGNKTRSLPHGRKRPKL